MVSKVCVPGSIHGESVRTRRPVNVYETYMRIPMKMEKKRENYNGNRLDGMPYILSFNRKNKDVT